MRERSLRVYARGFTLVALLISVAAIGIVILYALGSFTAHPQTYVVVDAVSETQQDTRAVASMIERDLRNAGYLFPGAAAVCGADATDAPDILVISDSDAIRTADQFPDALRTQDLYVNTATEPTTGLTTLSVGGLVVDEDPSYKKDAGSAALDSDFRVGGGAIVIDFANPQRGVACGQVTAVGTSTISVDFEDALNGANGTDSPDLRVVPAHYYEVNTGTDPSQLERDGIVLAKDVEDLQVAWFHDTDGDGQVDANEYLGDDPSNRYATDLLDGNDLREIRFHVVMTTRDDDLRDPDSSGTGQVRENRDPGTVSGDDGRRRRVYSAVVRIRNNAP